jgi:hypothetical protein
MYFVYSSQASFIGVVHFTRYIEHKSTNCINLGVTTPTVDITSSTSELYHISCFESVS